MSRKKRILFISLIILVLVCFLLSIFVFMAVKETKINFSTEKTMNEQEIISILNKKNAVPYGTSILFINREEIASKVECDIPKLKVKNIEVVFPNIIKINCEERIEIFYIEKNGKAFVLDAEMKVISLLSIDEAEQKKLVRINIKDELKLDDSEWELGLKIKYEFIDDCLIVFKKILSYYSQNFYSQIFCNHFDEVNIGKRYDIENSVYYSVLTFKTSAGKTIIFKNPTVNMDKRIGKLIAIIGDSSLTQDEIEINY